MNHPHNTYKHEGKEIQKPLPDPDPLPLGKWPGFKGVPFHLVWGYFFKGIVKGNITTRASSLSFNFFLALFPAIIFFFTLISYIPAKDFQAQLLDIISSIMPKNAFEATRNTIEDIVRHRHGGLLSFGFALTLYFSTNGVNAMIEGFNKSFHVTRSRPFIKQRIVAFILTMVLSLLLLSSIATLVLSEMSLEYLVKLGLFKHKFIYKILLPGKWLIMVGLLFNGISLLYYFGPSQQRNTGFVSPGSVLATVLSIITSLGFSYFVNNLGQYNKVYGSIGTLIVVLLWIYYNAVILLIGFELNASINNVARQLKR